MKCIVNRMVELATARINGTVVPTELTDVQKRVQDVFSKYDFGCHNEGVARILEAITGRKPSKSGGACMSILDVGTLPNGKRFIVVSVDGGYVYGFPVDGPKGGYLQVNGAKLTEMTKEQKQAIVTEFAKMEDGPFMSWICTSLGGHHPATLISSLD